MRPRAKRKSRSNSAQLELANELEGYWEGDSLWWLALRYKADNDLIWYNMLQSLKNVSFLLDCGLRFRRNWVQLKL